MKILLSVLILIFSLQSLIKADDIRDFEIEGMSVGDDALKYFSKKEIENEKKYLYKNKKYFGFFKDLTNSIYDGVQAAVKNDSNYIIYNLSGKIFYDNKISECYDKMDTIEKELDILFPNTKKRSDTRVHRADPTSKSIIKDKAYFFSNGDAIQVSCTDWYPFTHKVTGKRVNYADELKVTIYLSEFIDFLNDENY